MAEAVGVASGLLALTTFAFEGSISLYETIKSFQSHQQRVADLVDELSALGAVLSSLNETIHAISDVDFSALEVPVKRCGNACKDFEKELLKCSSRSGGIRTSFRDWTKLRYMGEDIDGFRRALAAYKLTISIALTDAHLRKSSATAESLEIYNNLLNTAKADLEDRLERIDDKLQHIIGQNAPQSEADGSEARLMKEERLSTVKCLQICAQLSDHISQIQLAADQSSSRGEQMDLDTVSQRITYEGLQECKNSLASTALKLEGYEKQVFSRLMDRSRTANISEEEYADITRLRDELAATRQGMNICSQAHDHLKDNASTIDNYATGDAVQIMVSTSEKTIHGKNRGLGWRTRQVGGHISDESLQQIARSLASIPTPSSAPRGSSPPSDTQTVPNVDAEPGKEPNLKFKEQYGRGFKLTPHHTSNTPPSGTVSADGSTSRSPRI